MQESGKTRAIFADFPEDIARAIKIDAAREGQSMKEWLLAASRARLRDREAEPAG